MTYLYLPCNNSALMASMHGHVNNDMVLRLRNKKINPNLAYNNKQTCKQRKSNLKAYKKVKTEAY